MCKKRLPICYCSSNRPGRTLVLFALLLMALGHMAPLRANESHPILVDVPNIIVTSAGVEGGIHYKRTGSTQVKTTSVLTDSSETSQIHESHHDTTNTSTWKSALSVNLSASLSMGPSGILPNLNPGLAMGSEVNRDYTQKDIESYQKRLTYTHRLEETQTIVTDASTSYDQNDGFVKTGLVFQNISGMPVTIRDIHVSIGLDAPSSRLDNPIIDTLLYKQRSSVYVPVPSGGRAELLPTVGTEPLEIDLGPRSTRSYALWFEALNSHQVLEWLDSDFEPRVTVDYKIFVKGEEVYPSQAMAEALKHAVGIQVIGGPGEDMQYFVAPADGANGVSLLDALEVLGLGPVATRKESNVEFIYDFAGKHSVESPWSLPVAVAYGSDPWVTGAWVVTATNPAGKVPASLREKAALGTRFVVAYITHMQALEPKRKKYHTKTIDVPESISEFRKEYASNPDILKMNETLPDDALLNNVNIGIFDREDIITISIKGKRHGISAREEPASAGIKGTDNNANYSRALLDWCGAKQFVPENDDRPLEASATIKDYGLTIDFGRGPIPLEKLIPHGSRWRRYTLDGRLEVSFVVTADLIVPAFSTNDTHALLGVVQRSNTIDIGRTVVLPSFPPGTAITPLTGQAIRQCQDWQRIFPKSARPFKEFTIAQVEIYVYRVP